MKANECLLRGSRPPPRRTGGALRFDLDEDHESLAVSTFRTKTPVSVADAGDGQRGGYFPRGYFAQGYFAPSYFPTASSLSLLLILLLDTNQAVGVLAFDCDLSDFFSDRHVGPAQVLGALLVYIRWHRRDKRSTPAARAVGEALRQVREAQHLTQQQLASQLGINRITLSRQESRAQPPSGADLYRWCQALGLLAATTAARVEVIDLTTTFLAILREDPSRLSELRPDQFERFVAERLDRMGYDVMLTGTTSLRDGGIDIIAIPKVRTVGAFMLAAQAKHHAAGAKTGRAAVDRMLAWKDSPFRLGLLASNTDFTKDALWLAEFKEHKAFLRLRSFDDLKRWIQDDFTSDLDWREIPTSIALAPGVTVTVPRPGLKRPELVWPAGTSTLVRR